MSQEAAIRDFLEHLDGFKDEAWAHRLHKDDKTADGIDASIIWRPIDRWGIGLNYFQTEAGAWFGVMSVSIGTPDDWKVPLLTAVEKIAGRLIKPEMGNTCVKFHWKIEEGDVPVVS